MSFSVGFLCDVPTVATTLASRVNKSETWSRRQIFQEEKDLFDI